MGVCFCVIIKINIYGKHNIFIVCQRKSVAYSVSGRGTAAAAAGAAALGCRVDLVRVILIKTVCSS